LEKNWFEWEKPIIHEVFQEQPYRLKKDINDKWFWLDEGNGT